MIIRQIKNRAWWILALTLLPMHAQEVRWPSSAEVRKITAAIPARPAAAPLRPRKLLVVGEARSHPSAPLAAKTIQLIAEKTGAFEAVYLEESSLFEPEKLEQYDAVLANNWNGFNPFLPVPMSEYQKLSDDWKVAMNNREAMLKQSLLQFVASGKGFIGWHAAVIGMDNWKEYADLIGAKHAATPWGEAILQVEDTGHPLSAGFHGRFFSVADEVYEFGAPYSRDSLRILLSVDPFQTSAAKNNRAGQPVRTDNDYGVSWVKSYGRGRVFYSALGQAPATYGNPVFLKHLLDGIQFALGDLPGETTPTARAKQIEGPRRSLIQQDRKGAVSLLARDVTIHGDTIRFEPAEKNSIGYWTELNDWVSWGFTVKQPGVFKVGLSQACGQGNGGSEFALRVGSQVLREFVRDTGSFTNFVERPIGEVTLANPGTYTLEVKPLKKVGFAIMDLRRVTLTPKPSN